MNPTTPTAVLLALALMTIPAVAADDPYQVSASTSCVPVETDPTELPPQVAVDPSCLKQKADVLAPDL